MAQGVHTRSDCMAELLPRAGATESIDLLIRKAALLLETLDRSTLAAVSPPLTVAQYHALVALSRVPEQSLSDLAARLLCAKANASGLVDRLETLGWRSALPLPVATCWTRHCAHVPRRSCVLLLPLVWMA